jgi:mRNA-degrading endonuclease toxin of MazEF toxin-antitoxin module
MLLMKRGEVWWVNFEPALGSEIRKKRPAVIVSNDVANTMMSRVQVVPVTSNIDKLYPSEAYVTVANKKWRINLLQQISRDLVVTLEIFLNRKCSNLIMRS